MKDPKNMRFGEFIRAKRLADPREVTLKDIARVTGLSLSMVCDVEQGRRKAFDDDRIVKLCEYLGLGSEDLSLMRDLAAKDKGEIPADLEDMMMYSEIGDMARRALRLSGAGAGSEEDWRQFIRQLERKKGGSSD